MESQDALKKRVSDAWSAVTLQNQISGLLGSNNPMQRARVPAIRAQIAGLGGQAAIKARWDSLMQEPAARAIYNAQMSSQYGGIGNKISNLVMDNAVPIIGGLATYGAMSGLGGAGAAGGASAGTGAAGAGVPVDLLAQEIAAGQVTGAGTSALVDGASNLAGGMINLPGSGLAANAMTPAELASIGSGGAGTLGTLGNIASGVNTASNVVGGGSSSNFLSDLTGLSGNALGSLASGAASLYGANQASNSAADAASISAASSDKALAEQRRQFDVGQTNQTPWMTAGKSALGSQLDLMGLPGGTTGSPTNSLAELQKTPGYAFRLDQGNRGEAARTASRGGMGSGKAYESAINLNQNMASSEYGNRLSQLSSLSGQGQAAASGMAAQGQNYANTASNTIIGSGANQANASIYGGQARQSGITGAANALSSYMNPTPQYKLVNGQYVLA